MLQCIVGYSNGKYTVLNTSTGKKKKFDTMKEALAYFKQQCDKECNKANES